MTELLITDGAQRRDLAVFADRVRRRDPGAVVRLRSRADGMVAAWTATGFDALACRLVRARLSPSDVTCGALDLSRGLAGDLPIDVGPAVDSAWRGALPPESGFVHLDDVPASVLLSLKDSEALEVTDGSATVMVPMRAAQALTAVGFLPCPLPEDEVVRVRATPSWLRVDARFGSVFLRLGDPVLLLG